MADDARSRLVARIEALRAEGKSDDEIRAMAPRLRTEVMGEQGGKPPVGRTLGEVQADLLQGAPPGIGDRLKSAGKYVLSALAEAPGAIAENPQEAGQVFGESATGAIQAAPTALANLVRSKDQPTRADLEAQMRAGFLPRSYMAAQPREASAEQADIDARAAQAKQERTDRQKFMNIAGNAAVAPLTPGGAAGGLIMKGIPAANVLARAGRAALAGGAGGAIEGTSHALAQGADVGEALKEGAVSGAVGAGLGVGFQGAAEVPKAARAAIQKISPTVGRYAKAKDAGLIPAAKELPKGQEGITRASEGARDKILARRGELKKAASKAYEETVEPDLGGPANMNAIQSRLAKIRADNTVTTTGATIDDALEREIATIEAKLGDAPTVGEVIKLSKTLKKQADLGNPAATDRARTIRQVYKAFKAGAKEASPAVKQADEAYAAAMDKDRAIMDTLGVPKGIKGKASNRKAAQELEYLNDDSVAALRRGPDLAQLIKMDPQIADALAALDAKKALEATRLLTTTSNKRTSLDPAVTQLPFVGGSVRLLQQYGRGLGRIADQGLANVSRAGEGSAGRAGNIGLIPFDPYRLKLEMALEERERRKAQR